MDTIILAASLISFFALMISWLALPASKETAAVVVQGVPTQGIPAQA